MGAFPVNRRISSDNRIEIRSIDEIKVHFIIDVRPHIRSEGVIMENHERIAIQQDSISARGNQNWNCNFHILLIKILVLPAQIEHALFMRTETVKRFPISPFEFQLGMVGLTVNHLFKGAGGSS